MWHYPSCFLLLLFFASEFSHGGCFDPISFLFLSQEPWVLIEACGSLGLVLFFPDLFAEFFNKLEY